MEGWELEALRGARETIARGGEGLALFVEMHPTVWRERGLSPDDVSKRGGRSQEGAPV